MAYYYPYDFTVTPIHQGIHPIIILFLGILAIWSLVWKGLGMWKAGKKDSRVWFVVLLIFNTLGILDILYIYVFSKYKSKYDVKKIKSKTKNKRLEEDDFFNQDFKRALRILGWILLSILFAIFVLIILFSIIFAIV